MCVDHILICIECDNWTPRLMFRQDKNFKLSCMLPNHPHRYYYIVKYAKSYRRSSKLSRRMSYTKECKDKKLMKMIMYNNNSKSCKYVPHDRSTNDGMVLPSIHKPVKNDTKSIEQNYHVPETVNIINSSKIQWKDQFKNLKFRRKLSYKGKKRDALSHPYLDIALQPWPRSIHKDNDTHATNDRIDINLPMKPDKNLHQSQYLFERRDILDKVAVESDMRYIRFPKLSVNYDHDRIISILKKHYQMLKNIFKKFCCTSAGSCNPFLMNSIGCTMFASSCNLIDMPHFDCKKSNDESSKKPLSLEDFDNIFAATNYDPHNNEVKHYRNNRHELTRYEFLELVTRIGMHVLIHQSRQNSTSDTESNKSDNFFQEFENFLCSYILPQGMKNVYIHEILEFKPKMIISCCYNTINICSNEGAGIDTKTFRKTVYHNDEIHQLIVSHEDWLNDLYKKMSYGKKFMSFIQFRNFIHTYKFGNYVAIEDLMHCFVKSAPFVSDEMKTDKHRFLNFNEFVECLCRICNLDAENCGQTFISTVREQFEKLKQLNLEQN